MTSGLLYAQTGFEQYQYMGEEKLVTLVPVIHIQAPKNWYSEARYNYEEDKTFSLYVGKNFAKEKKKFSYSIIPMLGGMMGKYKGGSAGLNVNFEYKKFFMSSQPQFTFFSERKDKSYFFQWSEVGYELKPWLFVGCSLQQTYYKESKMNVIERGVLLGVATGKWTFPIYVFSPLDTSRYFILGVTFGFGKN